jgi:uncharacterized protein YndB with AHSA1/START domain
MQMKTAPVATAEMLIRRPISEVFEAFVNPEVTRQFWFTNSSGRLEEGKEIRWDFAMYGKSVQVMVKAIEKDAHIVLEWGSDPMTTVEWSFTQRSEHTTLVSIKESGFDGDCCDDIVQKALGSTQGFALVLAGAKAFLEHNLQLELVADRYPDQIVSGWRLSVAPKPRPPSYRQPFAWRVQLRAD